MFELVLALGVCVLMAKIASADDQSAIIWFCVTFAFCVAATLIPLPFLRFMIAGLVSFAAMIGYKMAAQG